MSTETVQVVKQITNIDVKLHDLGFESDGAYVGGSILLYPSSSLLLPAGRMDIDEYMTELHTLQGDLERLHVTADKFTSAMSALTETYDITALTGVLRELSQAEQALDKHLAHVRPVCAHRELSVKNSLILEKRRLLTLLRTREAEDLKCHEP